MDPHSDPHNNNNNKEKDYFGGDLEFSSSFSASDGSKGKEREESERGSGGRGGLLFDDTDGSWGGGGDGFSPIPIRGSEGESDHEGWKGRGGEEDKRVGFLEVESEEGSDPNSLGFEGSFDGNDALIDLLGRRPSVSDEENDLF